MDESKAYYYIPIIGTISAGKSTFLKALLGIDFLEVGELTTTRFICLIKNSKETKFYHVIPKKGEDIYYEKDGEEINKEEEITKKIEEINKDLSDKEKNTNDIFYMLEVPFKYIDNTLLLEQCYFMDIPGLNEDFNFYIEKISSLISINDILFEIMVFDSTSIDSDNIFNIFLKLEEKNCLKKKNNLLVLNKIDHCRSEGEDNIIDKFKQIFYTRFEKEKSDKKDNIFININENQFLPMNSLLYMAESRINDNFSYCLLFELFEYLEYKKISNDSYYKYIQKKVKFFIQNNNLNIEDYSNKLNDKDNKVINKSIEYLTKMISYIKKDNEFHLGKKRIPEEIKKLYYIYKDHNYHHSPFKFKDQVQEFLNNLQISSTNSQEECKTNKIQKKNVLVLEEFENFLDETFKVIDPENELDIFKISLQSLRENILGKKLRIAFIGNINVGKSTVLNCIIGKDILPTKETECTYRGIIIRHVNTEEEFRLYKTKLIRRGKDLDEYYIFEADEKPYCIGDEKIKSYLNNKNNDIEIKDNDAFITIEGKLKIFDFISLNEELINSIEFVDLPGLDKTDNKFNEEYYQKILKFSNCCIYINEPKNIDDELSKRNMKEQYLSDKEKVFPELKNEFIKTCLFLINKSENLNYEKKSDIRKNIFNNMKTEEKDLKLDEINVSFFSGKSAIYLMKIYDLYVNTLEKNPILLFNKIFKDFQKTHYFYKFEEFNDYINDELSKIEEQLDLDLEDDENNELGNFNNQLNQCLTKFEQENNFNLNEDDKNNIIQKLYNLNQQIKSKNFEKTEYSLSFFKDLEKSIKNASELQRNNLNNRLEEFFSYIDDLFQKELKQEDEKEKDAHRQYLQKIEKEFIPNAQVMFDISEKNIKTIIEDGGNTSLKLIEEEINNIKEKLKDAKNDVKIAAINLEKKIKYILENVNEDLKKEISDLLKRIHELFGQNLKENILKKDSKNKIDTTIDIKVTMLSSFIISLISGIGLRVGLTMVGESILAGAATTTTIGASIAGSLVGPLGTIIGFGVGISISIFSLISYLVKKEKRYLKGLQKFKEDIKILFEKSEKILLYNFNLYRVEFFKYISMKMLTTFKEINTVDKKKWEEIKNNYKEKKDKIMKKIKSLNSENEDGDTKY